MSQPGAWVVGGGLARDGAHGDDGQCVGVGGRLRPWGGGVGGGTPVCHLETKKSMVGVGGYIW